MGASGRGLVDDAQLKPDGLDAQPILLSDGLIDNGTNTLAVHKAVDDLHRTGDVRAYVGSGGYYRDSIASRKFNPKYDAAGVGTRQPGSAWKPTRPSRRSSGACSRTRACPSRS